ncbi:hypothetical protein ZWY2020_007219 [Hordeum vulgare]|nr:hypothetical protein ZWY2020_007219 [Hordeum vulgare]
MAVVAPARVVPGSARLRRKSYFKSQFKFKEGEFKSLKSLVVEGSNITSITFEAGAAPKLEMIVWSFVTMEIISGLIHLPKLKKFELKGDSCDIESVKEAIKEHSNHPELKYNGQLQHYEAGTAAAGHDQLTKITHPSKKKKKITLSETGLGEEALSILGQLRILRCLRLRRKSYFKSQFKFKEGEFKSLKSLVVEGSNITSITFEAGAAPKLEMIVWSFVTMEIISGLIHLPKLKKFELKGDSCDIESVKEAIKEHSNHPELKYNGQLQHYEAGTAAAVIMWLNLRKEQRGTEVLELPALNCFLAKTAEMDRVCDDTATEALGRAIRS